MPPSIRAANAALLMIDFQRDFCEAGGYAEACWGDLGWVEPVIPRAAELLAACRAASVLVIHTREGYAPDLSDVGPVKLARSAAVRAGGGHSHVGTDNVKITNTKACTLQQELI